MKQLTAFAILCILLGMMGGYIGNELTVMYRRWRYNRAKHPKFLGRMKLTSLDRYQQCNCCEGSGILMPAYAQRKEVLKCELCNGSGKIQIA